MTKIEQLIALVKKLLDDANNLHIMDYEFQCGLGAFELSLKRKNSFLSPKKRRKTRQHNARFEIDLNIPAGEDESFQFEELNKRGCPRANNECFSRFLLHDFVFNLILIFIPVIAVFDVLMFC